MPARAPATCPDQDFQSAHKVGPLLGTVKKPFGSRPHCKGNGVFLYSAVPEQEWRRERGTTTLGVERVGDEASEFEFDRFTYCPYPGASRPVVPWRFPTTDGLAVVGVGALCRLSLEAGSILRCQIGEFIRLESGDRLLVRNDRGFSWTAHSFDGSSTRQVVGPEMYSAVDMLVETVKGCLEPDSADEHPLDSILELAKLRGYTFDIDTLVAEGYEVLFDAESIALIRSEGTSDGSESCG